MPYVLCISTVFDKNAGSIFAWLTATLRFYLLRLLKFTRQAAFTQMIVSYADTEKPKQRGRSRGKNITVADGAGGALYQFTVV